MSGTEYTGKYTPGKTKRSESKTVKRGVCDSGSVHTECYRMVPQQYSTTNKDEDFVRKGIHGTEVVA